MNEFLVSVFCIAGCCDSCLFENFLIIENATAYNCDRDTVYFVLIQPSVRIFHFFFYRINISIGKEVSGEIGFVNLRDHHDVAPVTALKTKMYYYEGTYLMDYLNHLNFRQQFLSSVHTRKMVNIEYTPDFPNNYHYEKELLSPLSPESFLYLLGGGSIHTDSPLAFRFPSMDCHLLLLTTMGSGRITTPGGSEGRGKKNTAYHGFFHP